MHALIQFYWNEPSGCISATSFLWTGQYEKQQLKCITVIDLNVTWTLTETIIKPFYNNVNRPVILRHKTVNQVCQNGAMTLILIK